MTEALPDAAGVPWARTALAPPRAHGTPLPAADLRTTPEDFRVEEQLSFAPSGDGPHWLLRVEKRAANTRWVAAELARLAQVQPADVGYAGLKDRHAVAIQWFSVPRGQSTAEIWCGVHREEFRVLEARANARKLKRGALAGNRFRIRLRHAAWSREELDAKLAALRAQGAPNYFGPQRFGRGGFNLERAARWAASGDAPRGRTERGFALSAARSLIFNAALARRVVAGDWSQLLPGDLASLDGSGSHFEVPVVDAVLQERANGFDIHPSGPLWGRGAPQTASQPLAYELEAAAEFSTAASLLEREGLRQERRALRCVPKELTVETEAATVTLEFTLGRGQFATAVLRELCEFQNLPDLDSGDD